MGGREEPEDPVNTPEDVHMAQLAFVLGQLEESFVRLGLPKVEICHCGVEITPDMPDHIACYPGME